MTRSQRQIGSRLPGKAFEDVRFIIRQEINFAKVKSRHFRRSECLNSVALDILIVRRDLHRSAKDFCDILREIDVVCVAKVIAAWKFSTPSAERIRTALGLTIIIRHFLTVNREFWDRRLRKPHHQIRRVVAICRGSWVRHSTPGNRSGTRSDTFERGKSRGTDLYQGHYVTRTEGQGISVVPETQFEREIETRPEQEIPESQVSMTTCEGGLGAARPSTTQTASQHITADTPEATATFRTSPSGNNL